jgi:hypothetical protein
MTWRCLVAGFVAGGVIALVGCVPEIHFADTAIADGAGSDAVEDVSGGSMDSGCFAAQPAAEAICCGSVWCVGVCDASCSACLDQNCDPKSYFCCNRNGQLMCKTLGSQPSVCR